VGDALGVPVESSTRQELALGSVKNMLGYGRYDQPEGTWSDDTAMILCTMDSLCRGYDLEDMGRLFCSWLFEGKWTACGFVFDAGFTTVTALESIQSGTKSVYESGCDTEDDNGNGSLMRMLPAALYFAGEDTPAFLKHIHEISAITHAHPRSKIGCGIYSLLIRALCAVENKDDALRASTGEAQKYYSADSTFKKELHHFERILSGDIVSVDKNDIYSSGYVVHTLEASIWCFMNRGNTKDILLEAVNLGLDTDTTGTVAGGLAGFYYGLDGVPENWIRSLAKKESINALINKFVNILSP
jgi:ADP-ribosylglycohydrolase